MNTNKLNKLFVLAMGMVLATSGQMAFAKEKTLNIASDNSGLSAEISEQLGRAATGLGVKEPLNISKDGSLVKITGASATICKIKLSSENKALEFDCN